MADGCLYYRRRDGLLVRIGGSSSAGMPTTARYRWAGTDTTVDPGPGNIAISGTGSNPRTIAVSEVDADNVPRVLSLLNIGDTIIASDDPDTPPITGFVRYALTSAPVDQGSYWTVEAIRTDTVGSQNPPPLGTVLRVTAFLSDLPTGGGGASTDERLPKGLVARKDGNTADANVAANGVMGALQVAFPIVDGRRYKVTASFVTSNRGDAAAAAFHRWALRAGGVQLREVAWTAPGPPGTWFLPVTLVADVAADRTGNWVADVVALEPTYYVGSANRQGSLLVEDVGLA